MTIALNRSPDVGLEHSPTVNLLVTISNLTNKLNESTRHLLLTRERLSQWNQDDQGAIQNVGVSLRQYYDPKFNGVYYFDMSAKTFPKEAIAGVISAMVSDFHTEAKKHLTELRQQLNEVEKILAGEPLSEPPVRKIRPVDLSLESTGQTREPVISEDIPF